MGAVHQGSVAASALGPTRKREDTNVEAASTSGLEAPSRPPLDQSARWVRLRSSGHEVIAPPPAIYSQISSATLAPRRVSSSTGPPRSSSRFCC